jgi:hypothetical protein
MAATAVTKVVPYQLSSSLAPTLTQLVLVEGPLGVGKRCLARSLQEPVRDGGGLFVEGSFLASQCASSYHASSNPEQAYNVAVSLQSPVFLGDVVRNVALSLDANDWDTLATGPPALLQYFTNPLESWPRFPKMMTALTEWRASWRETEGGGPERSHDALQSHWPSPPSSAILARFLGVVSTLWPLVMVMDRAHCANKESCSTLRKHLVDPETADFVSATKGLLMIWSCCNDAEMTEFMATFLSRCTANLDASGEEGHSTTEHGKCAWHNIELSNLTCTDTDPWIKEFLCREECPKDRIHPWSEFVYDYARGHPQRTRYILSIFKLRGWISRSDHTALPDLDRTHSCGELFRCTLEHQDALVQSVVLTVIAIRAGDEHAAVTLRVLDMVQQQSCAKALLVAEEHGLLESIHEYYQLTNQELQEEVYTLLTVSKRLQTHLWIGRRLWKHSDLELNDESMSSGDASLLPIIAQQLQLGSALVKDAQERNVIALIHWYAGKNAMKSSLFTRASAHFEFAISVLKYEAAWSKEPATWSKEPATWSIEHYASNLALYNNAAEAHFCLGDYLSMGRMVKTVLQNAVCFHDKLPAYTTLLFGRGAQFRHQEAVALALDLLKQLDRPVPANPTIVQVATEYIKVCWLLRGENDRYLASLPQATDSQQDCCHGNAKLCRCLFCGVFARMWSGGISSIAATHD